MTWHVLYDVEMAEEPPSRVEWMLTPATDDGSVHARDAASPRPGAQPAHVGERQLGWVGVLDSLKTLLETGEPLPAGRHRRSASRRPTSPAAWHRTQAIDANNSAWELLDGRAYCRRRGRRPARAGLRRRLPLAAGGRRDGGQRRPRVVAVVACHAVLGQGRPGAAPRRAVRRRMSPRRASWRPTSITPTPTRRPPGRWPASAGSTKPRAELEAARAVAIADDEDRAIVEADLLAEPWFGLTVAA